MPKDEQVIAMVAVKDIRAAAQFYEDTLGFQHVADTETGLVTYRNGSCVFSVYRSDQAGNNKATALTWVVDDDFEAMVRALRAKGVAFEPQGQITPNLKTRNPTGSLKAAWLKDPDGNLLNMVSR